MITFILGYFSHSEPFLSLVLGALILFLLLNKSLLHNLVKEALLPKEVQAGATLLLLAVGLIPLIPNQTIDPLHIFNPQRLAIIIALIAGIQFLGYAASRFFGSRIGLPLSGFLAGTISSTAVFASYPRIVDSQPEKLWSVASGAVFATCATLLQTAFLLTIISWPLALALLIPLGSLILLCASIAFYFSLKNGGHVERQIEENPLSLLSAIKLGCLIAGLIFFVHLSEHFLGNAFTQILTFLSALFELHGVVLANANLFENQNLGLEAASHDILLAVLASLVSKVLLTLVLAQGQYRKIMLWVTLGLFFICLAFIIIEIPPLALLRDPL
jgi:uncharacterized membrane protein (DUF4010 family)